MKSALLLVGLAYVSAKHSVHMNRHSRENSEDLKQYAMQKGFDLPKTNDPNTSMYKSMLSEMYTRQKAGIPIGAEPAMFYIEVGVGSPKQAFRVNLDTGSSTLAVFADKCDSCGSHCHNYFDHKDSSSFSQIECDSQDCCWTSICTCAVSPFESECGFEIGYADGSRVSGPWSRETVTVASLSVSMPFGRITQSTPNFEPYNADGIIGFAKKSINQDESGQAFDTFMDAAHEQLQIPQVYSMCFGNGGGQMLIGDVDHDHMSGTLSYMNVLGNDFFSVYVSSITISGQQMSSLHVAIIDSGTTLWLVPTAAYDAITSQLINTCVLGCDKLQVLFSNGNACVEFTDEEIESLPDIVVNFQQAASAPVPASSYLKAGLCGSDSSRTFGIMGTSCGTSTSDPCIYGDVMMAPFTWVFDMDNNQVGFATKQNCDEQIGDFGKCKPKKKGFLGWLRDHRTVILAVSISVLVVSGLLYGVLVCRRRRPTPRPPQSQVVLRTPLMPTVVAEPTNKL